MANKTSATALQKEKFKARFAQLVSGNEQLCDKYAIQFFETAAKSNYVINGLDGNSMNVTTYMSGSELDAYHDLKNNWKRE